ncbi:MAG: DUF4238 domain-containing protein [Candidatus Nealsonbacteria bacterium]|nr:DUF4238 domain-containing protein [Candidatus Nealsonbacteria bacterium]
MTDRANQHFVPQFYFRHFSTNERTIATLLTRSGKLILHAPIKGQCARKNFYGSRELESLFSAMESRHCKAIRAAIEIAWNASAAFFSPKELMWFFEAVTFQRGRVALEIDKRTPAIERLRLEMFKHYLAHHEGVERREEMIQQIDDGKVCVTEDPRSAIARSVSVALDSTLLVTDMRLCLIRNRTDYPFIFSDAPVVLYNSCCKNVRNRGVLGLQCAGLQIFFPLNPWTCALLLDADKYHGPFRGYLQYDVHQRSDVSQINALQLHHSLNTVYFGDTRHEDYVHQLWYTHRISLSVPKTEGSVPLVVKS